MAIASMTKVMIASHKDESSELLDSLQKSGLVQVLDVHRAMVTKEYPELQVQTERMRDLEETIGQLGASIDFLDEYAGGEPLTSIFKPLVAVNEKDFKTIVDQHSDLSILKSALELKHNVETAKSEKENLLGAIRILSPWQSLDLPIEDLFCLSTSSSILGTIPERHLETIVADVQKEGGVVEIVNSVDKSCYVLVVALKDNLPEIYKLLRASEFDTVNFESYKGTVASNIASLERDLASIESKLDSYKEKATEMLDSRVDLRVLYDYHQNLHQRETASRVAPATESTILLEGWTKERDYQKVEEVVSEFSASCVIVIEPGEDEYPPVTISNGIIIKPFEIITRLYGMPKYVEIDPTALLMPFFALFFALCLTDAAYGIILVAICAYLIKKLQGSNKMIWMLLICSSLTIVAGALTGGWLGAGVEEFAKAKEITWLSGGIDRMRLFDPLSNPMPFLKLSVALGYFQIMVGLLTGMIHNFQRKQFVEGCADHLSWLLMINCGLMLCFASKFPPAVGLICKVLVAFGAILVVTGSHREGGIGARLGMGFYNLTGAISYVGDILSYLRLMALGLGTAGVAIAVNIIAQLVYDIPYVGFILAIIVLIMGHLFNIAMSALGAFIHSLRLQFVEFFPKFLEGGGGDFEPLSTEYKHVFIESTTK